ncbi:MAG: T9SS type A sorting domain-containing protein, partial [Bacteroidetes bacterium]|nr:T9SS type A sorting domain-containing protein [Bacteroidota bacterium]
IQDTRTGKNDNWYYCTGEVYGNSADYPGDGIFKSTDNGKTWTGIQVENKPQIFRHLNYGWRLCLDHSRNDSDVLYLASYGAILRSNDGGNNWKVILGGRNFSLQYAGTDIAQTPSGVFYATLNSTVPGNYKGILRSEDGLNWTTITPSNFPRTHGRIVFDIFNADETLLYFLAYTPFNGKLGENHAGTTERNSLWKYRYVSGNGADSNGVWTNLSDNIPEYRQTEGYVWGDFMSQSGYNLRIRIKPDDSNVVAIAGTNLFISTDGFKSSNNTSWIGGFKHTKDKIDGFFNGLVYENHHPDIHELLFHPTVSNKLYTASDGGLATTDDIFPDASGKVKWQSLNNGYFTTQFYTAFMNQNPNTNLAMSNVVMGGFQDNETQYIDLSGTTNDDWTRIACCDGAYGGIFDDGDTTWTVTSKQLGGIFLYKFDKDGKRLQAGRIDPDGANGYVFINELALDPFNPKRMYLPAGAFVWMNTDITTIPPSNEDAPTSVNWHRLLNARSTNGTIVSIDVSEKQEGLVIVGTSGAAVYRLENGHDPENYSFTNITENNALGKNGYIASVATDPHNVNNILVAFSNYSRQSIFYTEDGGQNWRHVSGNLEENEDGSGAGTAVNVVKIIRTREGTPVYLTGTNSGLYSTSALPGQNTIWNREGANEIGVCAVRAIDYRAYDDLLFIGTHGCGSFSTNMSQIASAPTPVETNISVYPNPASDFLQINLGKEHVSANYSIFDLNGRQVKSGVATNNESIPIAGLKAGQYFIQVVVGEVMVAKKVVVD